MPQKKKKKKGSLTKKGKKKLEPRPLTSVERLESIRALAASFNKKLDGRGRIDVGADIRELEYQYERTGIVAADYVTNGGIIRGRISEWWGPDGAGKTTAAAHAVKEFQSKGMTAALAPIEGIDKSWWRVNGVFIPYGPKEIDALPRGERKNAHKYNKMYLDAGWTPLTVIQHKAPDEALDLVYEMTQTNYCDLIVVDSLGVVKSTRILEGKKPSDVPEYGGEAKLIGNFVGFMQSAFNTYYDENNNISKTGTFPNRTCLIAINQARDTMEQAYAEHKRVHPPGGRALRHGKSQSLYYGQTEILGPQVSYDGKRRRDIVAKEFRIYGAKMRGGPEGRDARFILQLKHWTDPDGREYRPGYIDNAHTLRALGVQLDIIDQAGAYYEFGDHRVQGKDNFDTIVREDEGMYNALYDAIILKAREDSEAGHVPLEIR